MKSLLNQYEGINEREKYINQAGESIALNAEVKERYIRRLQAAKLAMKEEFSWIAKYLDIQI
jgi:hypothetical protein